MEEAQDKLDPWRDGEAQRQDAELLEVAPVKIKAAIQEVILMITERDSIL